MTRDLVLELQRATHRVGLYVERFADVRVTQGEAHLLAHLHAHGDVTISELHRALAHKRSTLTSILDRLESRGLVTRATHESDRRSFVVELTSEGKETAARVHAHLSVLEDAIVAATKPTERSAYLAVLAALEKASE